MLKGSHKNPRETPSGGCSSRHILESLWNQGSWTKDLRVCSALDMGCQWTDFANKWTAENIFILWTITLLRWLLFYFINKYTGSDDFIQYQKQLNCEAHFSYFYVGVTGSIRQKPWFWSTAFKTCSLYNISFLLSTCHSQTLISLLHFVPHVCILFYMFCILFYMFAFHSTCFAFCSTSLHFALHVKNSI